jgi:capsular exopolysaccharide synthesis family protein
MVPAEPRRFLNGSDPENGTHPPALPTPANEPTAPVALTAPPNLAGLLRAVRRRWPIMLGLGLLGAAVACGVVWLVYPALYSTQSLIHLSSHNPHGGESEADFLNFQRTQTALLKSQSVLRAALEKPEVAELREVRSHSDTVVWLQKSLVTDSLLGPEILRVSLAGENAEDIPVILNEITRVYLREYAKQELGRAATRTRQLQENYRRIADNLREKRQRLSVREQQLGLDDPQVAQVRYQMAFQQLAAAQNQRLQVQLDREKAQEEHLILKAKLQAPDNVPISTAAIEDELRQEPAIRKQLERLGAAEETLQRFRSVSNPDARDGLLQGPLAERDAAQKALDAIREELRPGIEARLKVKAIDEMKAASARAEGQIALANGQERTLDRVVKTLESQVEGLRLSRGAPERVAADVEALRDEVTQTELVLKKIGDEVGTLAAEPPGGGRVTLLEAAEVPASRNVDRHFKVLGGAALSVFGLIVLGIALVDFRSRRVNAVEDVAQGLGLAVVGTLPRFDPDARIASFGSMPFIDMSDPCPDAVGAFTASFLHAARQDGLQVVMVASAVEGEGKTALAGQLAAGLARAWRRTLLIDCDLRRPKAHEALGVALEPGLCDALRGTIEFEQAIRSTHVNKLWMLPAGQWDSAALHGLSREEVSAFFARLRKHYDYVIINTAPVLSSAESLLIGRQTDAAILAVLRDVSRLPAVHAAYRRLTRFGVRVLGAVVLGDPGDPKSSYEAATVPMLK